jgi:hypothetical protein
VPSRATNRIRPTLDALEAREVCATLLGLQNLVHVLSAAQVGDPGPALKPPHRPVMADSVLTLRNATTHALRFTVRWEGAAAAQTYTLLPGQAQRVWVRVTGSFPLDRPATIRVAAFDQSGPHVFQVTAAPAAHGPTGPLGQGRIYTFRTVDGGLTLEPMRVTTR